MLEEVVDWQPFDHLAYRLAVPGIGPVEATYDLAETVEGTSLALRMRLPADAMADPAVIERLRDERRQALDRLPTVARARTRPTIHGGIEMIRYELRIDIAQPPAAVYRGLTDPEQFGAWTDMVDIEAAAGPPTVGDRVRFRLATGPIKGPLEAEYLTLEPDHLVVMRIEHPLLSWTSTSELTPIETGTEFRYAGQISLRGWRRLLEPFVAARCGRASTARPCGSGPARGGTHSTAESSAGGP